MIDYSLILTTHYSNKQWIMVGNAYEGLDWHDESPKPTQADLEALWEETENIKNSSEYKYKRAREYPSIADQFDLLYHGGYDAWKAEIDKIKEKYPKP